MSDPYGVLGVMHSASDGQIKAKYKELARRYHPDNFSDNAARELADEKMKAINEAYDQIMKTRQTAGRADFDFNEVLSLINQGNLSSAESILNSVSKGVRSAGWYYLNGLLCQKKGWLGEAMNNFSEACRLDPENLEYRDALNRMSWQSRGGMAGNPYGGNPYGQTGCSTCDMCLGLLCLDSCCDCLGGGCC